MTWLASCPGGRPYDNTAGEVSGTAAPLQPETAESRQARPLPSTSAYQTWTHQRDPCPHAEAIRRPRAPSAMREYWVAHGGIRRESEDFPATENCTLNIDGSSSRTRRGQIRQCKRDVLPAQVRHPVARSDARGINPCEGPAVADPSGDIILWPCIPNL